MNKTLALLAAVSAVAFTSTANAFEYTPYVAADYTYTDARFSENNGGKIAIGSNYNKYFGTEVFYQRTGSDRVHSEGETNEFSYQTYGLDTYGYLPMGCEDEFALVGTAGIANIDRKYTLAGEKRNTDNGLGYRLGAGVEYNVNSNVAVRALYRYTFADKLEGVDHMDEYSVGVKYSF